MTSKLKCPFCQTELDYDEYGWDYSCSNPSCQKSLGILSGTEKLWQALIQAKQDLETAKADIEDYKKYKALWEQIRNNTILELERKLEIARKALKNMSVGNVPSLPDDETLANAMCNYARDTLKQIEHKK